MSPPDRAPLLDALAGARAHVLSQVEALDDSLQHRVVVPSGWSPLGLVRHLTLSDERYWFEVVIGGGPLDFWPAGSRGDWTVPPSTSAGTVVADYREAIRRSDAVLAGVALDDAPLRPEPEWAGTGRFATVRDVLVHVVVETSTHAGQLDVARELLDGGQHLVLA